MRKLWIALNHMGMALCVFVLLTGACLWATGSLRIGLPSARTEAHSDDDGHDHAAHSEDDGHDHAAHSEDDAHEGHDHGEDDDGHEGHDHPADWCDEHGVPESACTKCDPALVAQLKAKGDWCGEHSLPESQCEACNPGCRASLKAGHAAHDASLAAIEKRRCEHRLPILSCDECRYQAGVVKVEPAVARSLLTTGKVERRAASRTLRMTGEVQLDRTRVVDVPSAASGRIIAVKAFLGQPVQRGDVLAIIHSGGFGEAKAAYLAAHTEYELARKEQERQAAITAALEKLLEHLARAKATPEGAESATAAGGLPKELVGEWKSKLLGAAARLRLAETNHAREKDLWDKGVSSKAEHDTAHHEWETAQAEYAALAEEVNLSLGLEKLRADNAVRKAEAALNATEQKLHIFGLDNAGVKALLGKSDNGDFARLAVKAPRAGTVIAQNASEGKFAETTDSLYTIADLGNLWAWCDLYARDLALLHAELARRKTLPATVRVAPFPDTTFPGTVDLVGSTVDEHTRTIKVRVQVRNPHGKLKPGMFATVEVTVPSGKKVALVPREAVLSDEDKRFVFQHWRDDLWVRRDVVVGGADDGAVEILAGLRDGAAIATGGGFMLKSDVLRNKMGAG